MPYKLRRETGTAPRRLPQGITLGRLRHTHMDAGMAWLRTAIPRLQLPVLGVTRDGVSDL